MFAAAGIDPATIPASLNAPSGPSWHRLILWLLILGDRLPAAAIPDVVEFYTSWSIGMIGHDPLTPTLLQWLYRWLTEIETVPEPGSFDDRREPFGGELGYERIRSLESDLRTTFLLFCCRTPELSVEYLRALSERRHPEDVVRNILKFRGSLAQAAPAELAELTANILIPTDRVDEQHHRRERPFGFLDHDFLPASPAQGPFLDILIHAPKSGLSLIRRLVDHASSFYSQSETYGNDTINISFPDGERAFPWQRSYAWSREGAGHYCVTSALMALEAWAHRRIEVGEDFDEVLSDVLSSPGAPAAYLQVAVDLVLSHWPKSREAAIPFLACPELLCIDRERHVQDQMPHPDFFGLKVLQKEPVGVASIKDLESRVSRRVTLEQLLVHYAFGPDDLRARLTDLLREAARRFGTPDERSNLGDPSFEVIHALNLADSKNWQEVSVVQDDGTLTTAHEYVPPEAERKHLAPLREAAQTGQRNATMQGALSLALDDPSHSSIQLASAAVTWAQEAARPTEEQDANNDWMHQQAVVTAAMIMMRDGEEKLRAKHAEWAHGIFARALRKEEDSVHRFRSGIRYNLAAIAFVGMVHALKDRAAPQDLRNLLESAARDDPAAAHGLGASAAVLASYDERMPPAILRCALQACIRPTRDRNTSDEEIEAKAQRRLERLRIAVDAEIAWLTDNGPEPGWPAFPSEPAWPRRRLRLPSGPKRQQEAPAPQQLRPDDYVGHQAAALWLANSSSLFDVAQRPWVRQIVHTYGPWTASANGAGLDVHDEIDHPPGEWNDAYLKLLAHCIPGLTPSEVAEVLLDPIISLPDEAFFDVVTQFLRNIDSVYFNDQGLDDSVAITVRSGLAGRLMETNGWKRLAGRASTSIESHIGPAIAVFFFNDHGFTQPAKCYLLPKGIDRVAPFLPVLAVLVASGPSAFVAIVTLNLLEVSPKPAHFPFLVTAASVWLAALPDVDAFWVDYGIGRRVCALIENMRNHNPTVVDADEALQNEVGRLLTALISFGVPEAARLEEVLAARLGSRP